MTHRTKTAAGRRWSRGLAATAIGALALAAPAEAEITGAGVRAGHNISVFSTIDFIGAFGYTVGTPMTVAVVRNGHTIASVTANSNDSPDGGALEVNHGPLGAPAPGDCWEGFTPDIRPGDIIRVTADGGTDEVKVDNIRIDQGPVLQANGEITMKGIAERADGTPIPLADLSSGEVRNTSRFRAMPDQVVGTPGVANGWTAVFRAPFVIERNRNAADPATAILGADVLLFGFGHVVPLPADTQMADGVGDTPGPALGCEGSPAAPNGGVGATSVSALNIDALGGKAAGDVALEASGLAAQGASSGTVTLSDGTSSVTAPAEGVTGGGGPDQEGWTARFTKTQIDTLADGPLTATPAFTGAGPDTTGVARAMVKDTVAPTLTADMAPGTYTGTQKVGLDAGGAARITYRTDGQAAATTDQVYGGTPIELRAGTHTITALAVDGAGNRTAASFAYTIETPAAPAIAPVVLSPAQTPGPRTTVGAPANRSLKVAAVRTRSRIKRAEARRKGLRVGMRLAGGTRMVRVSVYRHDRLGYELVARVLRVPGHGGAYTVRLNDAKVRRALRVGRYVVEVTPGGANGRLSDADARSRSLRIVR